MAENESQVCVVCFCICMCMYIAQVHTNISNSRISPPPFLFVGFFSHNEKETQISFSTI